MSNVLSIVIPVRDRQELVRRTLESIRNQTAPAFDVILVDNGSTDSTLEVLRQWEHDNASDQRRVEVLEHQEPGACGARNAGLDAVRTPWVLFFDSDDEMLPGHISRVLDGIEKHPEAQVLGWNVRYIGKGIKRFGSRNFLWNNLFEGSFATLRWCARTSLVREAGGWNPDILLWDDIELGSRILALHPEMRHLGEEITVEINPQEVSISTNRGGDYIERIEAPLRSIASRLPSECRIWTEYVRMIVAGNTAQSASARSKAKSLRDQVLARVPRSHRPLLRALYYFRRFGGRGQNHLLKLLLPSPKNTNG